MLHPDLVLLHWFPSLFPFFILPFITVWFLSDNVFDREGEIKLEKVWRRRGILVMFVMVFIWKDEEEVYF